MPTGKAAAAIAPGRQSLFPAGVVIPYVGEVAPAGWLLCYGQTVNKADYPALAGLCGTKFGAGSSTTFVLPDLRGRVVAGRDNMGGSSADRLTAPIDGDNLGASGGQESNAGPAIECAAGTGGPQGFESSESLTAVQPTIILDYIVKT